MTKVDLITGFLGAGKTTFIHRYIQYLRSHGIRFSIIENEFGKEAVDSHLLSKELEDDCDISDLTGLCMCCSGKDEFIYQLKNAAERGYDRVIVEPSGIYDVDEFFDVMQNEEIDQLCEIGCILTIADAVADSRITEEAKYLMFGQLMASGSVILSKVQLCKSEKVDQGLDTLNQVVREFGMEDGLIAPVYRKPWNEMTDADIEQFMDSGCNRMIHERRFFDHQSIFESMEVNSMVASKTQISGKIRRIFRFAACGKVFRIKGIAHDKAGSCFEINCTAGVISVDNVKPTTGKLVVIGQGLNKELIEHMLCS